jgi:hypothetical protein
MEAPKGRYSVVEKDGRLIVIDNGTGAPIPSTFAPPSAARNGGRAPPSAPITDPDPAPLDRAADLLLALAAKRRDSEGRAVIAWEWRENGKVRRWDAALDAGQQRRMGRALLALLAAPMLLVLALLTSTGLIPLALILSLPPLAWGLLSLRRLHRETHDPGLRR